tara:strand:+ start:2298 stop:2468 length:171 start_codon:yes stop_codon:yes gene_type:complete
MSKEKEYFIDYQIENNMIIKAKNKKEASKKFDKIIIDKLEKHGEVKIIRFQNKYGL